MNVCSKIKFTNITRSKWLRNFTVLVGGNGIAQAFSFLGSMVTARLYRPSDFGAVAVLTSITAWISYVAALRLDTAILAEVNDSDVVDTVFAASVATIMTTLVVIIVGLVAWRHFCVNMHAISIEPYYWVVILSIFISTTAANLRYWTTKRGLFSLQTKTTMSSSVCGPCVSIAMGLCHNGVIGLIMGMLAGSCAGIMSLINGFRRYECIQSSVKGICESFKRNRLYILYGVPQATLNGVFVFGSPIWISSLFGPYITGQYGMANKIVLVPLGLITGAISQLFMNEFSDAVSRKCDILSIWFKNAKRLMVVVVLPVVIIGSTAKMWIPVLFGNSWIYAGSIILWLIPMYIVSMVISPLSTVLNIIRKQKTLMYMDVLRVSVIVIWYMISLHLKLDALDCIVSYSLCLACVYLVWGWVSYCTVKAHVLVAE